MQLLAIARLATFLTAALDGPAIDYARDVKPILTKQCASCHGATKPRAGLRLDTAAAALKGNKRGPAVVPGKPDDSPLIATVRGESGGERMPLNRPPLSASQIETLAAWIDQGAKAPADERPDSPPPHWAFEDPRRPELPSILGGSLAIQPIDRFVLDRLRREGTGPSAEADKFTLIRRVSLDLIGLPPSPEEVDAFLADERPDAYERVVDRLLASPHFGERWARPWLDLARYADSNGYSIDAPRSIWKYRDWVIDALNRDQPFDEFAIDQIAGDLRTDATMEQKIATGFHRNTPINQEGGIDVEQFRVESVIDRVNTTGAAFLGLTIGCAQCHDHKYDPISQLDYYRLFAFFNNADEPDLPIATLEELALRDALQAKIEAYLDRVRADDAALNDRRRAWEAGLDMAGRQKQSQEVRAAFDAGDAKRTEAQQRVVFAAFIDQDAGVKPHRDAIAAWKAEMPRIVTTMVVREREKPRPTRLLIQGDFTRPGPPVEPGTPAALFAPDAKPANRLDLARWLVDRRNPLTARVAVNRLWQSLFGRGLVETEGDFGAQGAFPTHPELLDWLAVEFMNGGWSTKKLLRAMVASSTYRQSSRSRPDLAERDPSNRLLARQSRLRLDAELVRDAALAASGLLCPKIGGPGVFPSAARRGDDARPDASGVGRQRRTGPLSARALHVRLAGNASPAVDGLRRPRRRPRLLATPAVHHAAPGPDAPERRGVPRMRRGPGRARCEGRPRRRRPPNRPRLPNDPGPAARGEGTRTFAGDHRPGRPSLLDDAGAGAVEPGRVHYAGMKRGDDGRPRRAARDDPPPFLRPMRARPGVDGPGLSRR